MGERVRGRGDVGLGLGSTCSRFSNVLAMKLRAFWHQTSFGHCGEGRVKVRVRLGMGLSVRTLRGCVGESAWVCGVLSLVMGMVVMVVVLIVLVMWW